MNPTWPWTKGYLFGAVGGWALFLASVIALAVGRRGGWPEPALVLLAAVPAATVALQLWSAQRLMSAQDEFVRSLTARRTILAGGLALVAATAWSAAEGLGLPHLPAWLIYPLFWGLFGVVTPLIRASRA